MFFSLIKEIGRLIIAKHLLVRRIDIFSERKFEENPVVLKSKKVQDIFGETFSIIVISCLSSAKPYLQFFKIYFALLLYLSGFY